VTTSQGGFDNMSLQSRRLGTHQRLYRRQPAQLDRWWGEPGNHEV